MSRESAFAARPAVEQMALRDFLALDEEQFRALFRGSPIKRIKRRGFLRNVCVALGNVGTEEDLPALANAAARRGTAHRRARALGDRANRAASRSSVERSCELQARVKAGKAKSLQWSKETVIPPLFTN